MNKIHHRRIYYVLFFTSAIALGVGLILYALKQNINVFLTPSEITIKNRTAHFRLGGLVKIGSLKRNKENLHVRFIITDNKRDQTVYFNGILPDLFREGKGVIAEGTLTTHDIFIATQVLAKHDENYMPKKIYQKLRLKQNNFN